ncbi:hypothetical protein [Gemmobacter aquaticus]|uniref:hypothetical protein n=1 Tax=Gemmobacter aquaticus TaxID=490185 RepID=UPI0011B744FB|nr:hypothetical protein [Gemmobacter aquaticus]
MGRPRKNISDRQTASITITLTAARKQQVVQDASAAGMSVSAYLAARIFARSSGASRRAARDAEHLSAQLRCAAALEDLSRKTVALSHPEQCFDFGITLMCIERALLPSGPVRDITVDWGDEEAWE